MVNSTMYGYDDFHANTVYYEVKMMRKRSAYISVLLAGMCVAVTLTGCKKSGSTPDPKEYIELGEYKGLEYIKGSGEVTDEEVEEEMIYLASNYASQETVSEGRVELGDVANIDYEGKLNGVAFDGGTAQGYDLTIGSNTFIDGFEDGLIGAVIGESIDLNLTFPENYGSSELAGQDVVFTVKVNSVRRSVLPEITDEFIVEISEGQYNNVDEYKDALIEQMKAENLENLDALIYTDLRNMAVENATVIKDIPQEYIQAKVSRMLINAQDYAKAYGLDFESFLSQYMGMTKEEYNTQSIEYAKKAAKESLVIQAIADKEGITVTDDEFNEAVDNYVETYGYESRDEFMSSTNMDDFREYILISKVEEFLYDNAVITEN